MEKLQKSEHMKLLKLITIASLLIVAPLLSTSIRFKYLYFIFNFLVILVGAESGLLSFFLHSHTKNQDSVTHKEYSVSSNVNAASYHSSAEYYNKPALKCSPEKIVAGAAAVEMKKSPSTPSIFFIGEDIPAEEEVDGGELMSGQELFQKAENFIGDFYKQLKMQREESWKKLHGRLSHQAFN
ncbi:hypothetical protein ABFS82_08G173600 [Erythranthe guttata]|nr:PREDICTED: uncharacterized protein LOC105961865 [Erythranthe guttata]|eukprot:XP_012841582.1 PREDICTED: uncharacterized protein LOC105961865 [Erythranthe guttata]